MYRTNSNISKTKAIKDTDSKIYNSKDKETYRKIQLKINYKNREMSETAKYFSNLFVIG